MESAHRDLSARPLVMVLVGTDHHPFDRLVNWTLDLAEEGWADWFVQYGTSAWPAQPPAAATGRAMLGVQELDDLVDRAGCVVTHAGPGLLMDAHLHGHVPVVVPRDPAFGEHVDGHQLRFTAHIASGGRIRPVRDRGELRQQVLRALQDRRTPAAAGAGNSDVMARFASLVDAAVGRRRQGGGR